MHLFEIQQEKIGWRLTYVQIWLVNWCNNNLDSFWKKWVALKRAFDGRKQPLHGWHQLEVYFFFGVFFAFGLAAAFFLGDLAFLGLAAAFFAAGFFAFGFFVFGLATFFSPAAFFAFFGLAAFGLATFFAFAGF